MLKTLLLTDIVNSTKLTEVLGDERMSQIWVEHDHLARKLLAKYEGQEADRTDGFLMLFDSVNNACCYAMELHKAFSLLSDKWNIDFKARIGIHTGEIILIETAEEHRAAGVKHIEVEGISKPLAARVMSLASGGQTLLSKETHVMVNTDETPQLRTVSHGYWHLKGVEQPIELFELGDDETHFHPPADTEKVVRVVLDNEIWIPVNQIPNNLTKEADAFVGRKKELNHLAELIGEEHTHLVNILGPGGTGKTRLSKRFARMWLGDYPGGVWFCDLAEARSLEGIGAAIASALDTPLSVGDPIQQLAYILKAKGECLIILDNFEQVTEFAKATLGVWMQNAPEAKFIVTSRNRLKLPGEKTYDLSPLPIETDGVTLFVSRAKDRKHDFELNEENRDHVQSIVNQLDGMPLSIELAAARISILNPRQITERLKDRFKLLKGSKDVSERHQTLRATIDWSWNLLEEWEKSALAQCSVFEGGFTLEAAEEIIDLSDFEDAPMTMDVIQSLVDKSLLRIEMKRFDIDEPWYGMYVSINDYCSEKLKREDAFTGSGPEGLKSCKTRHAEHYAGMGTDEAIENIEVNPTVYKFNVYSIELDNLMAAHSFVIKINNASLGALLVRAIFRVVRRVGSMATAVPVAESTLTIPDIEPADKLRIYIVLIECACYTFDLERMDKYVPIGLNLVKELGDRPREGDILALYTRFCLNTENFEPVLEVIDNLEEIANDFPRWPLGIAAYQTVAELESKPPGKRRYSEKAKLYFEKAISKADELGWLELKTGVQGTYSHFLKEAGKFEDAVQCLIEALETTRLIGNKFYEGMVNGQLAMVYYDMGEFEEALKYNSKSLSISKELGTRIHYAGYTQQRAMVLKGQEKLEQAKICLHESLEIFSEFGIARFEAYSLANLGFISLIEEDFKTARTLAEKAIDKIKNSGDQSMILYLEFGLAEITGREGDYESATKEFKRIEDRFKELNMDDSMAYLMTSWARTAISISDMETGQSKLNTAIEIAKSLGKLDRSELQREIDAVRELLIS